MLLYANFRTGGLDRTVGQIRSMRVGCPTDVHWDVHWTVRTILSGQKTLMANLDIVQCHSPLPAVYTPMYMVQVTFIESGISQR